MELSYFLINGLGGLFACHMGHIGLGPHPKSKQALKHCIPMVPLNAASKDVGDDVVYDPALSFMGFDEDVYYVLLANRLSNS
jgi:hypothetical protein